MAYKDTINTTPDPGAPNADNPDTSAQDSGSGDSSSPYSLRNFKYAPYSTNTMKNQKKKEKKIYDKVIFDTFPCPQCTQWWYLQYFLPRCWLHQLLSPIFIKKLQIHPLLHQHHEKPEK